MLSDQQSRRALEAMRAYLAAPKNVDGSTPVEHYRQHDRARRLVIDSQLKPLLKQYLEGSVRLGEFKSKIDSVNKRNNLWGFRGIKGQMFFNMIAKVEDNEAERDLQVKEAIEIPESDGMASKQIQKLVTYVSRIAQKHMTSGGSLNGRPKLGSIPFFASYFWQVQGPASWPVYYTHSVKKMIDFNLWRPAGDLASDYLAYKRVHEELSETFSKASGLAFGFYDVEHVFWFHGGASSKVEMTTRKLSRPVVTTTRVSLRQPSGEAEVSAAIQSKEARMTNETDDYTEVDELEEDESTIVVEPSPEGTFDRRTIFTDKSDPPVGSLHSASKAGDLVLDPIFQRRKVWDDGRSSRLIESVVLEVPLPVFYFAESQDGTREVIDGQQRLTALFRFLDNEYCLSSLKALPALNGHLFKNLEKSTQRAIRDCAVRVVLFKKESDENLRFEIFERLNTGAVPLNDQELRNCIYRGPYNELLVELSKDADYMRLMGFRGPEKRFKDVEYVLRFAAFYHATYLKYRPSMGRFLTEDMAQYQRLGGKERGELQAAFKTSTSLVWSLLGRNAFKRYYGGDGKSPNGRWEPKKFNASLYDVLMGCFAGADKNRVMANLDSIREALMVLMTEDRDFIDAIELSTSSAQAVRMRFDKWRLTLDTILGVSQKQPRCFSRELKTQLYRANPTCALCDQQIADLDDAAVDHIDMYWLGGKTIPENARLAHRYCNWARPKKTG